MRTFLDFLINWTKFSKKLTIHPDVVSSPRGIHDDSQAHTTRFCVSNQKKKCKRNRKKKKKKRFHARDLNEDQAWSDRLRCMCDTPWSSVKFTRLETVKPDPDDVKRRARCRGCSWHPRNVDPGRGHFYLSLAYARNFSGEPYQPLPFSVISIELRIPVRSLILFYRLLSFVMTVLSLFSVLRPREFDFLRLQVEYI